MEEFCGDCQKQQRHFREGRGIYLYDDKMRTSVLRYKYGGRREYGSFFAASMCHYARCEILRWQPDLILPIPLHKKTRRQRGFNQAELLAERIGACYGIPVSSAVLAKRQQTHSQKKLSEEERRLNLKKAFFVERPVKNLRILLIDDVFTTGSTIDAAAQCLCKAGAAEIFFLTLCIAVREVPVADVTVHADV
jgi:ComF family protein